ARRASQPGPGRAAFAARTTRGAESRWPGRTVTARITMGVKDAVVVPTPAVQVSPNGTYVYVVEDAVARVRPVEVGWSTADEMVLRSGLSGGESVVTDGHLLLSDRMPVRIANR